MVTAGHISEEFRERCITHITESHERILKCIDALNEEQLWLRTNAASNSIGNLVLHLNGNITQYILSSLGGQEDMRERDLEFKEESRIAGTELKQQFTETITEAIRVIKAQSVDDLMKIRSVQGFTYTGLANILHVTEHLSYHTGQIAFWTKLLKDKDLGFYDGMDLNVRNL